MDDDAAAGIMSAPPQDLHAPQFVRGPGTLFAGRPPMTRPMSSPSRARGRKNCASDVLVLSDRPLFRDCVVAFLQRHGFPKASAGAKPVAPNRPPTTGEHPLVLMDLGDKKDDAAEDVAEIHRCAPKTPVVAIGTPMQLAAQAAEADGWIKTSESGWRLSAIAAAIGRRRAGGTRIGGDREIERHLRTWRSLTVRQREVLALLGCGVDNHKLAKALRISDRAVKMHVSALLDKFKADNRVELALIACHAGLHRPSAHDHLNR